MEGIPWSTTRTFDLEASTWSLESPMTESNNSARIWPHHQRSDWWGHRTDEDTVHGGRVHYLPHHAVIHSDKETTEMRIVYDASAKVEWTIPEQQSLYRSQIRSKNSWHPTKICSRNFKSSSYSRYREGILDDISSWSGLWCTTFSVGQWRPQGDCPEIHKSGV